MNTARLACEIQFGNGSVTKVWRLVGGEVARLEQTIGGSGVTVWLTRDEWEQIGAALGWAPGHDDRSTR